MKFCWHTDKIKYMRGVFFPICYNQTAVSSSWKFAGALPRTTESGGLCRNSVCVMLFVLLWQRRARCGVFGDADRFLLCFFSLLERELSQSVMPGRLSLSLSPLLWRHSPAWIIPQAALRLHYYYFFSPASRSSSSSSSCKLSIPSTPTAKTPQLIHAHCAALSGRRENVTQQRKHINHAVLNKTWQKYSERFGSAPQPEYSSERRKNNFEPGRLCFAYRHRRARHLISSAKVLTLNPTPELRRRTSWKALNRTSKFLATAPFFCFAYLFKIKIVIYIAFTKKIQI